MDLIPDSVKPPKFFVLPFGSAIIYQNTLFRNPGCHAGTMFHCTNPASLSCWTAHLSRSVPKQPVQQGSSEAVTQPESPAVDQTEY